MSFVRNFISSFIFRWKIFIKIQILFKNNFFSIDDISNITDCFHFSQQLRFAKLMKAKQSRMRSELILGYIRKIIPIYISWVVTIMRLLNYAYIPWCLFNLATVLKMDFIKYLSLGNSSQHFVIIILKSSGAPLCIITIGR